MGQIIRLDRWIHLGFPVDLPTDVDLQAGVRRVRTFHRPQKMLLNSLEKTKQIWMPPRSSAFIPSVCLLIFLICYFPLTSNSPILQHSKTPVAPPSLIKKTPKAFGILRLASNLYFAFDRVRWSSSSSSSLPCGALRRRRRRYRFSSLKITRSSAHIQSDRTGLFCCQANPMYDRNKRKPRKEKN